jgi:hypothetical protein
MPREEKTGPEITFQADIGGVTIALIDRVEPEQLDVRLDTYRRAIERQRAFNSLTEALVDLVARTASLAGWEQRRTEALKGRAIERVRLVTSFQARAQVSKRRQDGYTATELNALDDFDKKTEEGRVKLDQEREQLLHDIPICEAQVARQRAIVAGRDRIDIMSDEVARAQIADAAD